MNALEIASYVLAAITGLLWGIACAFPQIARRLEKHISKTFYLVLFIIGLINFMICMILLIILHSQGYNVF